MLTMHPVVLHGCTIWDQERLPLDEFTERLRALTQRMRASGLGGAVIYSDVRNYAGVCYLTQFIPKHSYAVALVTADGEIRLLAKLAGTRDVPYVRALSWVSDIQPVKDLAGQVREFAAQLKERKIGICGKSVMGVSVYNSITQSCEDAEWVDWDAELEQLMRQKSYREISVIRDTCGILRCAVDSMRDIYLRDSSVVTAAIEAERAARCAGAMDVRVLYSVDAGNTLLPIEGINELRSDPAVVYVAVQYSGYWADGFVTLSRKRPAGEEAARTMLLDLLDHMKEGTTVGQIVQKMQRHEATRLLHPAMQDGFGYAIGLSRPEKPCLHASCADQKLQARTVWSVRIGLRGEKGGWFASALVAVGREENELLWSSLDI